MRELPMPPDVSLRPEQPQDFQLVDRLYEAAFGPGRHARTAWRLRGGARHDPRVSFVAERRGLLVGAIRQSQVTVGGAPAFLLGPLAVAETAAKKGIGSALMHHSIAAARTTGAHAIVLIGDAPYYRPFGFCEVTVTLPLPWEPHRLLAMALTETVSGALLAIPWDEAALGSA
ncbi:MAG: N-acetyltransferase [Pseudomonadota bacterium]